MTSQILKSQRALRRQNGGNEIENSRRRNDGQEAIADVDEDDENHDSIEEDDGAKDKHTDVSNGKIEAKPGFFVTQSELAQLRIFLPGFKSIPNERLYNVLPRLMNKTPGDPKQEKGE